MKLITSLVRPCKLDAIRQSLHDIHVCAISVLETRDFSPQKHETTAWMGRLHSASASPKMEIRVIVHDDDVDEAIATIIRSARTGEPGDGHVCVIPVDHRYDIRTGRRDVS